MAALDSLCALPWLALSCHRMWFHARPQQKWNEETGPPPSQRARIVSFTGNNSRRHSSCSGCDRWRAHSQALLRQPPRQPRRRDPPSARDFRNNRKSSCNSASPVKQAQAAPPAGRSIFVSSPDKMGHAVILFIRIILPRNQGIDAGSGGDLRQILRSRP